MFSIKAGIFAKILNAQEHLFLHLLHNVPLKYLLYFKDTRQNKNVLSLRSALLILAELLIMFASIMFK